MDRRNFFKVVGTASGGALSGACGKQAEEIIPLLVPEEEIAPGVESWHASVCLECAAGCGTLARVTAADREIAVDGERFRQRIAAIKKIEGNPADPVSGGRLCARGHASLQSLYNPDRLRQPLKRSGERGSGDFEPVTWDAALAEASTAVGGADPDRILFLAQPRSGSRSANVARFLQAVGAPPAAAGGSGDFAAEIEASKRTFGWSGLPVYDVQDATLVLSIGADFLGGWASPVLYARRYGHMRQGRRELRGRLVHAESRFSLTAANADRWLPVRPGGELAFATGVGWALLSEGLAPSGAAAPEAVAAAFNGVDPERASAAAGIPLETFREVAADLAAASAPVVLGGASMVRANSTDAVAAANALNVLLGRVNAPGGVRPPAGAGQVEGGRPASRGWRERLAGAEVVLLDAVNPVYNAPSCRSALASAGAVVSFSPFLDDSSAYADWILPDHDPLERSILAIPDVSPARSVAAAPAFVAPLHDTRATESVLAELAGAVGKPYAELTLEESLDQLEAAAAGPDGGIAAEARPAWSEGAAARGSGEAAAAGGGEALVLQAYPSVQFGEGGGANKPWLQELPDPASSAMWCAPAELDPATAGRLGVANGDRVRIDSAHGSLAAPVYVNPAALPGVVSMALGQGHEVFGRYATGRGANPMTVVGDLRDVATGATALGPTPVTVRKAQGEGGLIQFSRQDSDLPPHRV